MRRAPALAALLLAGCTVGPDYGAPKLPVPDRFAEAGAQDGSSDVELATWWHGFGDPVLGDLIGRALAKNLDLEAAEARLREARAREGVAGAASLPRVSAQSCAPTRRARKSPTR